MIDNFHQVAEQEIAIFHSLAQFEYVGVMGITKQGLIPLVRQYRPVLNYNMTKFLGDLLESNESTKICVQRVLNEEVGCFVNEENLIELGCLFPETGRLSNKYWLFWKKFAYRSKFFCQED